MTASDDTPRRRPPGRPRADPPAAPPPPELLPLHVTRLARGLTNRAVAERSGLPLATVANFFAGRNPDPSISTVLAIARGLGVELAWLGAEALSGPADLDGE